MDVSGFYNSALKCAQSYKSEGLLIFVELTTGDVHSVFICNYLSSIEKSFEEEDKFVEMLDKIGLIAKIVTFFVDKEGVYIDICSYNFRKKIIETNTDNENAIILLQGETKIITKTIISTMS